MNFVKPYNPELFTEDAIMVLNKAMAIADYYGKSELSTEYIVIALVESEGVASEICKELKVSSEKLRFNLENKFLTNKDGEYYVSSTSYETMGITPKAEARLDDAVKLAKKSGAMKAGTEHLLMSIMDEPSCLGCVLLRSLDDVDYVNFRDTVKETLKVAELNYTDKFSSNSKYSSDDKKSALNNFTIDLTKRAERGELEKCIGRETEMDRVFQILSRRTKNNPCLIGDPGVGKTAIVEGLAYRIATKNVPQNLANKRILSLDITAVVAGTKYRGDFENRMKQILNEIKREENIILFIDELHMIMGAGGSDGASDAANIIKPALARGDVQIIAATTNDDYKKSIEKDSALERRFQTVLVEEPGTTETIAMLRGIVGDYEKYHGLVIDNEAVNAAVNLSERYVNDRFLPDKAIDALDEACSRVRFKGAFTDNDLSELKEKYKNLEEEKEKAIFEGRFDYASAVNKEQELINVVINKKMNSIGPDGSGEKLHVTAEDVADIISEWTHVPVKKVKERENERLKNLEDILHERVVGQDEAVAAVAKAVRRGRTGLKDPNKPIGSFLFLGPTGVGKTELSKVLADAVFGDRNNIIRVDMSEYMEKHSVSKFIGSPPGYVGYDEGGQLSEKIRKHPYSVVLFDEIEKAHPDVFNMLLQILDEGHVTDSQGRKVSFKNTILIMTSNAGAQRIVAPKLLGFGAKKDEETDYNHMKESVMEEVKNIFKPEFINRIDDIIVFHMLNMDNVKDIVRIMLKELKERVSAQIGLELEFSDKAVELIAKAGFDDTYGARPVKREIVTKVEDVLAEKLVEQSINADSTVFVDADEKELIFNTK
ncbi:MAG: ATP-dependent Clp protease ATP-binding subunit [Lachnospiraceae bacterium]|nr:ATP-dependent Clp protease ATP-binding subunit [Lachnospiraceae bacterium]